MTFALFFGTLLAVVALAFVLYPLFFSGTLPTDTRRLLTETHEDPITVLREIEFDRVTGKLSDSDYAELKARYTRQAVAAMRRRAGGGAAVGSYQPVSDDEIEEAVRAYRARHAECAHCGPRPELDAVFCSSCGRRIPGR